MGILPSLHSYQCVQSTHGTSFVPANSEVREMINQLDEEKLKTPTTKKRINWNCNPSYGSYFEGVHNKTMIKSTKKLIYKYL